MSKISRCVARLLVAFGLSIGVLSFASAATLDQVRARGHLICGSVASMAGFSERTDKGLWSGFDVDFCRAVAAAVLGNPDLVEFKPLSGESRFADLQTGAIDLLARDGAWNLQHDTLFGVHYVGTSFFDGLALLVRGNAGVISAYELKNVSICMGNDATERKIIEDFFFETQASFTEVHYEDRQDLSVAYAAGLCDAIAAPASWLNAIRRGFADPSSSQILPERLSKLPLGPVVRQGDPQWFNIVRWTLFALVNAEELGVTSLNIEPMLVAHNPAIRRILGVEGDFGTPLGLDPIWMRNVIRSVGNYGEIYARNFGSQTGTALPRGLNALWTKGGLLYAPPVR